MGNTPLENLDVVCYDFTSGVISIKNIRVYIIEGIISISHFYAFASICHFSEVLQKRLVKSKPERTRSRVL